ncbi:MAG: MoaD/ThiS family protein [Bacteroidota bacterium]
MSEVTVRVLLFSVLRESVGTGEVQVALPEAATGTDLLDRLGAEHPAVAQHRPTVRLAVNRRYVPVETPLAEGDEVALITPVSGG